MNPTKEKLQLELNRIMEEIEKISKPKDFGSDVDGMDEEADEAEAMANRLAIAQDLKNRANEIEEALRKIENGTYGICDKCGEKISKEILDAAPESLLCQNCKKSDS